MEKIFPLFQSHPLMHSIALIIVSCCAFLILCELGFKPLEIAHRTGRFGKPDWDAFNDLGVFFLAIGTAICIVPLGCSIAPIGFKAGVTIVNTIVMVTVVCRYILRHLDAIQEREEGLKINTPSSFTLGAIDERDFHQTPIERVPEAIRLKVLGNMKPNLSSPTEGDVA